MKKKFTLLLFAILSLTMGVNAQSPLTFQWAHSVDGNTSAGDNVLGMCKSSTGGYFVATAFGSSSSQTDALGVWLDGEESDEIEGSPYTGTSQNNNLVLQKVATDGTIEWTAFTDKGDVDNTATQIAATPDGGAILAVKCRAWVEAVDLKNLLEYESPNGETQVKNGNPVKGEYKYVILKVNSEGEVDWCRVISGLVKTDADTGRSTVDNAYINGLTVDEQGNIFISGNYRTELNIPKDANGNVETLVAKNSLLWDGKAAAAWTGDPQMVVGDLFLIKLDSNGYFVKSLLADGTAKCAFLDNVVCNDGKLYLTGRVQGDGTAMSIGGKSLTASADYQTQILLSVNTSDLTVNYLNALTSVPNSSNRFVIQNKSAQYLNGKVYFTGLLNGGLRNEGATSDLINNNGTLLKGYVLQLDPTTGSVSNAAIRTAGGIGGFFGVYENSSSLYAFGYDFSAGAVLVPIDKSTFTVGTATTVCSFGTVANAVMPIVDGSNVILANRGGKARVTDNVASFYGTDFTLGNIKYWGSVYYSFKVSE